MHRALQIVEVVEMVCEQVAASESSTLSRLARTSAIFMNPALNVLWTHQATIVNILRCMPEDLWDIMETHPYGDDLMDLNITLRRPVTFADWTRFFFYSKRVKSFSLDEQGSLKTTEVYEVLNLCFPERYIFPNLRKLDWDPMPSDSESYHYIRLFLTPAITEFDTSMESPRISLLPLLAFKCPGLTHLSIGGGGIAVSEMSRLVCDLHHLESLVTPGLDRPALTHIARLPRLRYLWLMSFVPPEPPILFPAGSLPFPSLKSLEIETIEHAPAFFEILGRCSLEEITILSRSIRGPYTETKAKECWSALAAHCSHSSLQTIWVQSGVLDWATINVNQLPTYSIEGDTLRPLFSFRSLVMLSLKHPVGFDLDDDVVREMAYAWPHIERLSLLSLSFRHFHHIRPRVTLDGIHSLAKHCSHLQELSLTFDATVVPQINTSVPHHTLTKFNVGYSPVEQPHLVAEFLLAIFPSLESIRTLQEDRGTISDLRVVASHKGWKQVEEALW